MGWQCEGELWLPHGGPASGQARCLRLWVPSHLYLIPVGLVPLALGWGRGVHGFGLPFCPPHTLAAPSVSGNPWELRRRGVRMPPDLPCGEMAGDLSVTPPALHHGAQRPGHGGPLSPPPSYPTIFLTPLPRSSLSCQEPASEAPRSACPSAQRESLSACAARPSPPPWGSRGITPARDSRRDVSL